VKLKFKLSSTTFAKVDICFGDWFGLERVAKISFCTTQTLFIWPLTEFLSFKTSKFEMPQIRKVVSLDKMYNFFIGRF
jgi:hypothetical protein